MATLHEFDGGVLHRREWHRTTRRIEGPTRSEREQAEHENKRRAELNEQAGMLKTAERFCRRWPEAANKNPLSVRQHQRGFQSISEENLMNNLTAEQAIRKVANSLINTHRPQLGACHSLAIEASLEALAELADELALLDIYAELTKRLEILQGGQYAGDVPVFLHHQIRRRNAVPANVHYLCRGQSAGSGRMAGHRCQGLL